MAFDSQPTLLTGASSQVNEDQKKPSQGIFDNIGSLQSPRNMLPPQQQVSQQQQPQTPPRHQLQTSADSFALQQGLQFATQFASTPTVQPDHQVSSPSTPEKPQQHYAAATRFAGVPNTVALAPNVERLDPILVQELLRAGGCVLVDVRSDDRASGTVQGAINVKAIDTVPFVSKVPGLVQTWRNQPLIIFHCQYSAHRAPTCANWYREQASPNQRVAIMDGGFRGWESSGLPVASGSASQQPPLVQEAGTSGAAVVQAMPNQVMPGMQMLHQGQHHMMTPVRHM